MSATAYPGLVTSARRAPSHNDVAIQTQGLVKQFGSHRAVDGIDLTVQTGTVFGVLGPNGAGKTTTVRMLATLLRPDGGRARIFGHDVVKEEHVVRQLIGVTGQYASVDETLSALENLIIFARLLGFSRPAAKPVACPGLGHHPAPRPRRHDGPVDDTVPR